MTVKQKIAAQMQVLRAARRDLAKAERACDRAEKRLQQLENWQDRLAS